jgi:hypothetical protein
MTSGGKVNFPMHHRAQLMMLQRMIRLVRRMAASRR